MESQGEGAGTEPNIAVFFCTAVQDWWSSIWKEKKLSGQKWALSRTYQVSQRTCLWQEKNGEIHCLVCTPSVLTRSWTRSSNTFEIFYKTNRKIISWQKRVFTKLKYDKNFLSKNILKENPSNKAKKWCFHWKKTPKEGTDEIGHACNGAFFVNFVMHKVHSFNWIRRSCRTSQSIDKWPHNRKIDRVFQRDAVESGPFPKNPVDVTYTILEKFIHANNCFRMIQLRLHPNNTNSTKVMVSGLQSGKLKRNVNNCKIAHRS